MFKYHTLSEIYIQNKIRNVYKQLICYSTSKEKKEKNISIIGFITS